MNKVYHTNMKRVISKNNLDGLYEITDSGDVYSIKTNRKRKLNLQKGYYSVILCNRYYKKSFRVHRLVWETFVGKIPSKKQINHKDGNPINNNLSNLEVVTPKQNTRHAWKNGLCKKRFGVDTSKGRLTTEEVNEIRKLYSLGFNQKQIAEKYKCHQTNIHYILTKKTRAYA